MTEQQLSQRLNEIRKNRNDKDLFEQLYKRFFEDLGVSPLITRSKVEDLFDFEIRKALIKLGLNPKVEINNGVALISCKDAFDDCALVMSISKDKITVYNYSSVAIKRRVISLVQNEDKINIAKIQSGFIAPSELNDGSLHITNNIYGLSGMENVSYNTVYSLKDVPEIEKQKLREVLLSQRSEESFLFSQSKINLTSGISSLVEYTPYLVAERLFRRDTDEIDKVYSYNASGNRKFFVDGYFTALDFGMGIHTLTPRYDKPVDEETFLRKRKKALKESSLEEQLSSISFLLDTNPELYKEIIDGVESLRTKKLELK